MQWHFTYLDCALFLIRVSWSSTEMHAKEADHDGRQRRRGAWATAWDTWRRVAWPTSPTRFSPLETGRSEFALRWGFGEANELFPRWIAPKKEDCRVEACNDNYDFAC